VRVAAERRTPYQFVYRILTRDGRERWLWEQGRGVCDETGEIVAFEGFATDVTGQRLAEDSLARQTQELVRSNEALNKFAMAAYNDLQEPLRMVALYNQLLKERYRARNDQEAEHIIGPASRARSAWSASSRISRLFPGRAAARQAHPLVGARPCCAASFSLGAKVRSRGHDHLRSVAERARAGQQPLTLFQHLLDNAELQPRPLAAHIAAERREAERFSVRDNGIGSKEIHLAGVRHFKRLHGQNIPAPASVSRSRRSSKVTVAAFAESEPGPRLHVLHVADPADPKRCRKPTRRSCTSCSPRTTRRCS
jgi:hypothetical protein